MVIFEWVINILFFIDICFSCITAYWEEGTYQDNIKVIFKEYMQTWFIFDLLSVFPFEIFILFS